MAPDETAQFDWLDAPHVRAVVAALEKARPGGARFVGGCVRDGLVGVAAKDIDIATQLRPQQTMDALRSAGLRAEPTGFEHGTITAAVDGEGIEVTSLRADVETDGRRAVVAFTDDWRRDAVRRDFTINALYLTPDRRLFDPWGGVADLRAGRVRFIGAPDDRIREDYLRILRFFRFSARFAAAGYDADGLEACARLAEGVERLSKERIGQEISRLLLGPRAGDALKRMAEAGVLARVHADAPDIDAAAGLMAAQPDAPLGYRLAALWPRAPAKGRDALADDLRLSNADAATRNAICGALDEIEAADVIDDASARALAYRHGPDIAAGALRLAVVRQRIKVPHALLAALDGWTPPSFPLSGGDVTAAGVAPGPEVGEMLRRVERRWVAEGFPDAARVKAILAEELPRRR
ncbi:MAG: CCA tRNA nucleotidyltransferase [Alphaproteobacteria bacterium]|nr:CCA tRNA nucleotidyltransferase [Alphaproteobacteria bacterium]